MTRSDASTVARAAPGASKVFCIGFNKTGVKTLEQVLREQLGLRVIDDPQWTYWTQIPALDKLSDYDAFVDGECANVTQLDAAFPGSRFILNTRRLDRWLISRHHAVERSRLVTRWITDRVVGATPALIEALFFDNGDAAMARWVQMRNSYHAHVLGHFAGRSGALLVVDVETEGNGAFLRLETFLGLHRSLQPVHRNRHGDGNRSGRLYGALFGDQGAQPSEQSVARFLERTGLRRHAHVSAVIDDPQWFLPPNFIDRVLTRMPSLAPWHERLLGRACGARDRAHGILGVYLTDRLVGLCRAQSRTDAFVPIDRYASSSR